jgi:hypothetical protein
VNDVPLPALDGANPLGFLAALGVLDILAATTPGVTLRWTDDLIPHAIISGTYDLDQLLETLDKDRAEWPHSSLLRFPEEQSLSDAKPDGKQLRAWFEFVSGPAGSPASADHLCAIVAEGAFDNNGKAKPTHLHFTAGRQQFLNMVRTLALNVDKDRLHEAVCGPWRYDSVLPSLSWDSRGERIYAIRATNPSDDKRRGVPGADWLAFRGLVFYPTARTARGTLRTTACDADWKDGAFRWPLWQVPATRSVVRSLVADRTLVARGAQLRGRELGARGIASVRQAVIRRNDQGGYGSFGAAEILAAAEAVLPGEQIRAPPQIRYADVKCVRGMLSLAP